MAKYSSPNDTKRKLNFERHHTISTSKPSWVEDEIILKIILITFANGAGPYETPCTLAYLDLPNTKRLCRRYHYTLEEIHGKTKSKCSSVIHESLVDTIEANIRALKLGEGMSTEAIS